MIIKELEIKIIEMCNKAEVNVNEISYENIIKNIERHMNIKKCKMND